MTDPINLAQSFKLKYNRFKEDCDKIQNSALSDNAVFYGYDLSTVALRFIAANGIVKHDEVKIYNDIFDFEYTAAELLELYRGSGDMLMGEYFDNEFGAAYTRLRGIDEGLAMYYLELLDLLGNIISASDGEITPDEIEEMDILKALCV